MKKETKLLCRDCTTEAQSDEIPSIAVVIRYDLCGYCENCSVNTGHLNIIEITNPNDQD